MQKKEEEKRENGQLLLFDGQLTDDKDYAIVFFMMFWSNMYLFLFIHG